MKTGALPQVTKVLVIGAGFFQDSLSYIEYLTAALLSRFQFAQGQSTAGIEVNMQLACERA